MNKELKAFEKIKEMYEYFVKNNRDLEPKLMICEKEDFATIKTALKEYEKIKQEVQDLRIAFYRKNNDTIELCHAYEKKLKALEIIKEKMVSLDDLNDAIYEDNYHQNNEHNAIDIYNQNRFEYKHLTQEEFDLLKEVLL